MEGYVFPAFYRVLFTGTSGSMQRMLIALNQLPDDIDALKSLAAVQVARNEQLQVDKQSVVQ
jgi:hypothetical protein